MEGFYRGKKLPVRIGLQEKAKLLRNNLTSAEKKLWFGFLRRCKYRFLRQKPILDYIADFYCPAAKLIVELDGDTHYTQEAKENDAIRTADIEKLGIKVIRYTNNDVYKQFAAVCEDLVVRCDMRMKKQKGEGE